MFLKNIFALLTVILVASCAEVTENPVTPPEVPEGELWIFADKTSVDADGSDQVTFKVMFGSEDVSSLKTMHLSYECNGVVTDMAAAANVFSSTSPGEYVFRAYLYRSGEHYSKNEVKVIVNPVEFVSPYAQKVVALQFTSVGCTNCPLMSTEIRNYQERKPGVLIPLAFHTNYNMTDPMTFSESDAYHSFFKLSGYPSMVLNFRATSKYSDSLDSLVEEELEAYPSTCGVAVSSVYNPAKREAEVTMKVTSATRTRYKYHIILVEDGIEYMQSDVQGNSYVHNNVVRATTAPDITGTNMNDRKDFTPGTEVTTTRTLTLAPGWTPDNIRVIAVVLSSQDGGTTYNCNNANECVLGQSADYVMNN